MMNNSWQHFSSSIVLVLGKDTNDNEVFGTGFVYAADEYYSYVLTSRHLLKNTPWRNLTIDGEYAYQIYEADIEEQDYVILAVNGIQERHPPLKLERKNGIMSFPSFATLFGYRQGVVKEAIPIAGQIIGPGHRDSKDHPNRRVPTLTFSSGNEEIEKGYSGAPLIYQDNVIGFLAASREIPRTVEIITLDNVTFTPPIIEFKNRDAERDEIITDSHALKLITAPTGYGKTMLFSRLKKYYLDTHWLTASCQVRGKDTLQDVAVNLAAKINPNSILPNDQSPASALARQLTELWKHRDRTIKGIALFIDLQERDDFEFRNALLGTFVPEYFRVLEGWSTNRELSVKQQNGYSQYLRVFVTGKHLASDLVRL